MACVRACACACVCVRVGACVCVGACLCVGVRQGGQVVRHTLGVWVGWVRSRAGREETWLGAQRIGGIP